MESSIADGATVPLDGTGVTVDGFPQGNWVGPTVVAGVTPEMEVYKNEVFGPVLQARACRPSTRRQRCSRRPLA